MDIISHPSPNFNPRDGHVVDMLVLHYTGMRNGAAALDRLCEQGSDVSCHYLIEEDGRIFQLVDEENRAWHAGKSHWRGHSNINQRSIGIEIVNPGHEFGYRDFPEVQMQSVIGLCKEIVSRHAIPARNVVGHSDVAPMRKDDPGEKFDWKRLAGEGIGVFPDDKIWRGKFSFISSWFSGFPAWLYASTIEYILEKLSRTDKPYSTLAPLPSYADIQKDLASYGYDCPQTGVLDDQTKKVILAFQRHFYPKRLTGIWDRECRAALASLLSKV